MACQRCVPWNLPLHLRQVFTIDAGNVAMRFEQWLDYHCHVVCHQTGSWSGELEAITQQLQSGQEPFRLLHSSTT